MDRRLKSTLVLLALLLALAGCAKKAKIDIVRPGEMKLTGVSKIALLDFNTIAPAPGYGVYAADKSTCALARNVVADVLYREPFYQLVDFNLEDAARGKNPGAKLQTRADAFLYGKVWWQASPEYDNFVPSKLSLEEWGVQRYVCGRDSKGRPYYCTAHLTRKVTDEFYKHSYRATNAALMLGLTVYRLEKNGRVTKLSNVFEIARHPAIISNGEFSDALEIVGRTHMQGRADTLKTESESTFDEKSLKETTSLLTDIAGLVGAQGTSQTASAFGSLLDIFAVSGTPGAEPQPAAPAGEAAAPEKKEAQKDFDQQEMAVGTDTIPTALECKTKLCTELSGELARLISPRSESFEVPIAGFDQKTQKLILESAYAGLVKYVGEGKLAGGDPEVAEFFYSTDFIGGARQAVARAHKAAWQADRKNEPYRPLSEEELNRQALSYLSGHTRDIYNLGLGFEALGDFDRALEIYRFGFERFNSTDQDYADGIGRCLFALDMADRVIEEDMVRVGATDKTKL